MYIEYLFIVKYSNKYLKYFTLNHLYIVYIYIYMCVCVLKTAKTNKNDKNLQQNKKLKHERRISKNTI